MHVLLIGVMHNFPLAAALTFGFPIGIFALVIVWAFFQRRPLAPHRRTPLFPLSGHPQHLYQLEAAAVAQRQARATAARPPSGPAPSGPAPTAPAPTAPAPTADGGELERGGVGPAGPAGGGGPLPG
ncbi:MAG: hypothetical protein ACRD0L_16740 [Acidimicrobiales bacterium]